MFMSDVSYCYWCIHFNCFFTHAFWFCFICLDIVQWVSLSLWCNVMLMLRKKSALMKFTCILSFLLWSLGKLTDVFEGSIVRVIRRLEELLRQLATAATAIGNMELKKLFEDGASKIRRGVVFAASLYL